ncbi:MAG: hypothetical protein ABJI92_18915 [Kangiellaceae bacterium]
MKNLNKLFTAFALMILVGSANILAQETANVAVTAQVEAALVLTPTDVALGTIQTGANSIIDANSNDDATEANLGDGATAGALQIVGTSGVDVVVDWTTATLNRTEDDDPIVFTPSVWLGGSEVTDGGTVTLTGGDITLDVGGELAAPSQTGAYSTSLGTSNVMTFTITYD